MIGENVDESVNTDHASTAAKILIDYDTPANLYADPDGATHSAQAVALESPYEENDRRSSTIFPRKEDSSVPEARDVEPTERDIYIHELAESVANNARLTRTAAAAEEARLAAVRELAAARQELAALRQTRPASAPETMPRVF